MGRVGTKAQTVAMRASRLLLVLALTACRVSDVPFDDQAALRTMLPSLTEGVTTRAQVLLELGMPVERFEHDRILGWRIVDTGGAGVAPVSLFVSPYYGAALPAGFAPYTPDPRVRIDADGVASLMLAFDERGVLRRASLLRQRRQ